MPFGTEANTEHSMRHGATTKCSRVADLGESLAAIAQDIAFMLIAQLGVSAVWRWIKE
jgi:hypothetical protein